jgi:hypothetical protein
MSPAAQRENQRRGDDSEKGKRGDREQREVVRQQEEKRSRREERSPVKESKTAHAVEIPPPVQTFKSTKINLEEVLEKGK